MHALVQVEQILPTDILFPMDEDWYALLTESNKESRAVHWLQLRQFKPYWPKFLGTVKLNRHRRGKRFRSVMPGYIFLPLGTSTIDRFAQNRTSVWDLVKRAPGVRSFLKSGSNYATLSNNQIDHIREIEAALNSSEVCAQEGIPFKVGETVRVIDDLYQWTGPITAIEKGKKITVEVQMFGRPTRVTLPVSKIERI